MNSKYEIIRSIGIVLSILGIVAVFSSCSTAKEEQPNIIFFFIDDMGWQDTSVPFYKDTTELNRVYHTPNMENLARQGVKFTQAYACALCSPSRISLMTGLNAARHKVTNWTLRKDKSPDWEDPIIQPPAWNLNGMSQIPGTEKTIVVETLPNILRKSGYRTIHVGKAHFGSKGTPGENPLNLGFDVNIAGHAPGGPGSYLGKNNFSAAWRNADLIWDVPGLEKYHGKDIFLTEALTIEAIDAVEEAVAMEKPFYLYMSHYAIHAPWEIDDRYYKKYLDAGLNKFNATYAAMIEGMDKSLGDLMMTLKRLGIEKNTIVVFMSDNGQPSQATRNRPLRGHKLTPYEGGVRVPMLIKWPGKTRANSVCSDYVIIEDIFPSFLEMAGVDTYSQVGGVIDGQSFVPFLSACKDSNQQRPIFWHFPHTYDQPPYSSIRKGDWKLIYHHVDRKLELFNLEEDIGERNNLAEVNPKKLRELAKILSTHLRESEALMPVDKRSGKTVEYPDEALNQGN